MNIFKKVFDTKSKMTKLRWLWEDDPNTNILLKRVSIKKYICLPLWCVWRNKRIIWPNPRSRAYFTLLWWLLTSPLVLSRIPSWTRSLKPVGPFFFLRNLTPLVCLYSLPFKLSRHISHYNFNLKQYKYHLTFQAAAQLCLSLLVWELRKQQLKF